MWPPPATDFRPGGGDVTETKNKRKRKNKKRRSSSQDYTTSTTASTGDHVNGGARGPTRSPPRRSAKPSPEQQQQQQQRAGGVIDSAAGATRARRNSEDVVAAAGGGSADGSGEVVPKVGGDASEKDYDDDDDDEDQDEGVVIQREGTPTPALANGTENAMKKKKKIAAAAAVASGNGVGGAGADTAAGNATELAKKEKRKAKEKRPEKSQGADDSEEVEPSGIPFALPLPGARATPSIKPTGRSRSASIESAAEFFSTKALSGDKANGTADDGRGDTVAKSDEGAISNGGVREGGEPGHGLGRRKREEGSGGVGAATAALDKERVPRKHQEQRRGLPIFAHKANIIRAVKDHQTVVVVGETGSGKSTQIPQFLYEAGITRGGAGWIPGGDSGEATTAARGSGKKRGRAPSQEDVLKGSSSRSSGDKRGFQGGLIACTQPRRVAAVTVAKRVAAEVGCDLGNTVGYTVRFDDRSSKSTRIKYMTDGVLLREAMSDPLLSAYSAIVLDEAHERSLDTDILFGLVRRLQPKRLDLKVVVMSATLDVDLFRRFFRDSVSLHVPGRTHPVDVMYATEDQDDYLDACLMTCLQIHEDEEGDGDVLVFLPGQDDIEALSQLLRENLATLRAEKSRELAAAAADAAAAAGDEEFQRPRGRGGDDLRGQGDGLLKESMVCPVFAALPQEQQLEAFEPAPRGTRKFVLATNIAETSITINGIRYVVDSGKVKVRSFQASTGMEFLRSQDVSKAQATQRAGRAGREAPGVCYRLFREDSYLELGDAPVPEILRVNLAQVVLQLKVMGIDDPSTFDYVTAPSRAALLKALKTLAMLGALDKSARVTPDGKKMAALPLDPAFAHLLVRSAEPRFSCVKEVLTTVACLSAENLLFYPPKEEAKRAANEAHRSFSAYEGDLPTLLRIYESFLKERKDPDWCRRNFVNGRSVARAVDVRQQLAKILRERLRIDPEESCGAETSQYLRCLVAGLFTNVALRQPSTSGGGSRGCYRTVLGGREAQIHPSSSLWRRNPPAKCVVFTELLSTSRDFIKTVTAVDSSWLRELVPQYFKPSGAVGVSS